MHCLHTDTLDDDSAVPTTSRAATFGDGAIKAAALCIASKQEYRPSKCSNRCSLCAHALSPTFLFQNACFHVMEQPDKPQKNARAGRGRIGHGTLLSTSVDTTSVAVSACSCTLACSITEPNWIAQLEQYIIPHLFYNSCPNLDVSYSFLVPLLRLSGVHVIGSIFGTKLIPCSVWLAVCNLVSCFLAPRE